MAELKIERYKWQPGSKDETWIIDKRQQEEFTITLKQDSDIEIEFTWDYGYGARGSGYTNIPVQLLKDLLLELGM